MSFSKHSYNTLEYDFQAALRNAFTIDGWCYLDVDISKNSEAMEALTTQLRELRSSVMDTMHSADFQHTLEQFSLHLASKHFNEGVYFQRIPSIRLTMPDALGTSWHTDNWYGHGPESQTFWVPITEVKKGAGISFVTEDNVVLDIEKKLSDGQLSLEQINGTCEAAGSEELCEVGEYLKFDGRQLHGSVGNSSGALRCSIDFRGSPMSCGVGNKPLSNYRLIKHDQIKPASKDYKDGKALKYINGANSVSTKYQHILLEAYAGENKLAISRNEAEIESIPSKPVLSAYSAKAVPNPDEYDHILVHSLSALPSQPTQVKRLLNDCREHNVSLHFALEDLVFPDSISEEQCLEKLPAESQYAELA